MFEPFNLWIPDNARWQFSLWGAMLSLFAILIVLRPIVLSIRDDLRANFGYYFSEEGASANLFFIIP